MYYTDSHEWVQREDSFGKVGVTQYAVKELGEIVSIEFPKVGKNIKAGEVVCILESTKAAAEIYAPVSGTVTRVNEELLRNIQWLNDDSESKGWLFELELSDVAECDALLEEKKYLELVH